MSFFKKLGAKKTLKPMKGHKKGTRFFELHTLARKTLGTGNISQAVQLPEGHDLNEWLAVHTVDFYNDLNLLYGFVIDDCTVDSCPSMTAGRRFEYLWADGETIKTPIKVPAREYVDLLMTWVEGQINDDKLFPTSVDTPFPKGFTSIVKRIFKRLFRVYAHIYFSHFDFIEKIEAVEHLNTCFKHFMLFVLEFKLIDKRELEPLKKLIAQLVSGASSTATAGKEMQGGGGSPSD